MPRWIIETKDNRTLIVDATATTAKVNDVRESVFKEAERLGLSRKDIRDWDWSDDQRAALGWIENDSEEG
jgi:hypothetical protein